MKNLKIPMYSLVLLMLGSCGLTREGLTNQVDDDVYWKTRDRNNGGTLIKDVEPWNKPKKGPEPTEYQPTGSYVQPVEESQSYSSYDRQRAEEAYRSWNAKRAYDSQSNPDTPRLADPTLQQRNEERDERRLGSDRSYYYDDPYYNSLSSNWGWTSFYAPVYRPGFYNWAPGWNMGLGWNRRQGWNVGVGYNFGWGGFYSSPYGYGPYGYSPYGFNSWYDPFYSPWGYGGYGYYNYGYCSPWGYYHPWYGNYYSGYYSPWGYYGYGRRGNYYSGRDIVSNRPMFRQRTSLGGSIPATGSRPGGASENGQLSSGVRPGSEAGVPINRDAYQPAMARPVATPRNEGSNGRPTGVGVSDVGPKFSNRPGGDLISDQNGRPVYVPPARDYRAGMENGGQVKYSNRPGGDLIRTSDDRQVYIPARPAVSESPRNYSSPQGTIRTGGNESQDRVRPGLFSRPSSNDNRIDNRRAAPEPAQSRPSFSVPASPRSAPSGGGGGFNGGGSSGGSSGGGSRSRPR